MSKSDVLLRTKLLLRRKNQNSFVKTRSGTQLMAYKQRNRYGARCSHERAELSMRLVQ